MPSDNISRSAAKEAIEKQIKDLALAEEACRRNGAFKHVEGLNSNASGLYMALAALDSLPAAEADGRWEKLREHVDKRAYEESHGSVAIYAKSVAFHEVLSLIELFGPAAPSPPAADGAERPPMLYACCESRGNWYWHMASEYMDSTMWVRDCFTGLRSGNLLAVDRHRSDSRALAIYDNDISNSGPAAQLRGEG